MSTIKYQDISGRLWVLIRKLPGGRLELFDDSRKRFMTVEKPTADTMLKISEEPTK